MARPATFQPSRPAARLALADGAIFRGEGFGAIGRGGAITGEVVFNTAMSGYQESLTDPSYAGQILTATFPLIGNYGVNEEDVESARAQVAGFVVRELARRHSNYRATTDLDTWLRAQGVLGITGIDTRALTRRLRITGAMPGALSDDASISDEKLIEMARAAPDMSGQNLVPGVGTTTQAVWNESLGDWAPVHRAAGERRFRVLALDCGAKRNILRNLVDRGCEVTVIPHDTPAETIRGMFERGEADGLFVSNGPGDPAAVEATIATLRETLGSGAPGEASIPTFGICLGHQLLSLALGAKTYKLKFGHRGANQPVLNTLTRAVEITSQNHGFAVDPATLPPGAEVTHINLNDQTCAGFRLTDRPVFAVQHHPEASPGPHDAGYLFDAFVEMMAQGKSPTGETMRRAPARA